MNALQFRHVLCTAAAAVCSMLTAVVGSCRTDEGGQGGTALVYPPFWHTSAFSKHRPAHTSFHRSDTLHAHLLCTFAAHCTMPSPRRSGAHPRRSADPWPVIVSDKGVTPASSVCGSASCQLSSCRNRVSVAFLIRNGPPPTDQIDEREDSQLTHQLRSQAVSLAD